MTVRPLDANGVAYFEVKANEKDEFNEEHCYLTMAKKQEELQRKLDQESREEAELVLFCFTHSSHTYNLVGAVLSVTRKRGANAVVALLSKKFGALNHSSNPLRPG